MPASRLVLAIGVVLALLVGAVAVPAMAYAAIALDLVLLLLGFVDHRRAARTDLSAARRVPALFSQGARATLTVEVRTKARRSLTVQLRETLHPLLSVSGRQIELLLPPEGGISWEYELVPRARGTCLAGPLTARVLGPWRLAWAQRELLAPQSHRVYPKVRWQGEVGRLLALARRRELGRSPWRLRGTGSETYALREYLKGDPPSKIHWKATARHGRLVSREETWEQGARLIALLDCARTMASLATTELVPWSKLDHALGTTLALTRVAAGRGDRVTIIAFSDRIERVVPVGTGARGVRQAYEKLFDLSPRLGEPAYDLASEAALDLGSRFSTVVLFTSVVDLAAAEMLQGALRRLERRHRPLLIHMEDPELSELARGAPRSSAEAFAKVSSLEILLENRRLARRLRREGVRVVTTAADRLTLDALEAYLSVFRPRATATRTKAAG
jgi:uncharacterized protein (DUF58 family)